jgi:tyrosine-protein phosphatase non-receptor type 23
MEAVPRLPMMDFELKTSPDNVDFASKLRDLIVTNFGEDPSSFSKEIKELESLR